MLSQGPEKHPEDSTEHPGGHRTSTVEQGSFSAARCACGWRGPARRARAKARADAAAHSIG
ncbi:hypothetical protein [Streptomyces sp. H27-D2]|uniref:hypothetical protein n=1 Tax=Streptomyces sp. H27-D2 TaxID=3046304 RepID=UPI002DBAC95C|nr:hypothetical protein [Streptomyces sp. H27-D2]MEC4015704.1 hypothetical protein [Streptomyces sp. H27-D2]